MKELVLLKNDEVFTTSEIIAEGAEVSYRSVQKLIEKYYDDISDFGQVRFEITPLKTKSLSGLFPAGFALCIF